MGDADSRGEVTLIEAARRPASLLPLAAARALQRADLVIAAPQVHPNVLWHAPASATFEIREWDEEAAHLAEARARAGSAVVVVLERADETTLSVPTHGIPGVPPSHEARRGPLAGQRILVTRPWASALAQRDRFEDLGADAVALPCLRLDPPGDLGALDDRIAQVRSFDGVILTSRAGVEAFFAALARVGLDARALFERTVVAVGRATAKACAQRGIKADIIPTQARSEGIVDTLRAEGLLDKSWLHVRAEEGRDTIDHAISNAGGRYVLAAAYRAERPAPPPGVLNWVSGGVDVVCLHSGKTGSNLREILALANAPGALEGARVVSAGPVTTKALQEQGFEVAATADSPGDEGMVRAVLQLAATSTS